jgi:hypothetical protein
MQRLKECEGVEIAGGVGFEGEAGVDSRHGMIISR